MVRRCLQLVCIVVGLFAVAFMVDVAVAQRPAAAEHASQAEAARDEDGNGSRRRTAVIIGAGTAVTIVLAVQQRRSRLQTRQPDEL